MGVPARFIDPGSSPHSHQLQKIGLERFPLGNLQAWSGVSLQHWALEQILPGDQRWGGNEWSQPHLQSTTRGEMVPPGEMMARNHWTGSWVLSFNDKRSAWDDAPLQKVSEIRFIINHLSWHNLTALYERRRISRRRNTNCRAGCWQRRGSLGCWQLLFQGLLPWNHMKQISSFPSSGKLDLGLRGVVAEPERLLWRRNLQWSTADSVPRKCSLSIPLTQTWPHTHAFHMCFFGDWDIWCQKRRRETNEERLTARN